MPKGSMVWKVTVTHGRNTGVLCYTNQRKAVHAAVATGGKLERVRLIGRKANLNPTISAIDYMYLVLAEGKDL